MDNSINKNRVNWLKWGKEAFEKAKKEGKPILLDLTAVWCHWCHVMDSTSYSDEGIAETINQHFVPVKVYIDERPDIRERYNMGGFPSTVFLDSGGNIIVGDTFIPPKRFKLVLESVKSACKNNKNTKKLAQPIFLPNSKSINKKFSEAKFFVNNIIKDILLSVEDSFDSFYGGFGTQPKFPCPEVLDFLFFEHQKTKAKKFLDMALKTLDGMHEGIYDNADYGFFRYSVTQDWKTPHYEKMLDTNAGLLSNYADAFDITKDEKYRQTAIGILGYINKFLSDRKNGGFYGTQDADEEFYNLKPEERKNKKYPYVDKTIYVDWNAMMISSYIRAGIILKDDKAMKFALKSANFILKNCYSRKNGMSHLFSKGAGIDGLLGDNIHFLNCLIDAYSAAQSQEYLEKINLAKIKEIAEFIMKNFYDEKIGGFFDRIAREEDIGALKVKEKQFLENCFSSIVFLRVHSLTKDKKYRQAAEKTLLYFIETYQKFGYFAAIYGTAVDMLFYNSDSLINNC